MKKINKHGLKMRGLKAASGETKNYGYYSGHYVQISYDTDTGDILTNYHYSLGQNSWTRYHDPAIITVATAAYHMTMQEIADAIAESLCRGSGSPDGNGTRINCKPWQRVEK